MDIAGEDHVINVPYGTEKLMLDFAARCSLGFWPEGIIMDALTGRFFGSVDDVPFHRLQELFVFRTLAEMGGYSPGDKTMVHLLVRPGELTLHVDPGTNIVPSLLQKLRSRVVA